MSDIENIPVEMKEHDIFCCWKEEMRNGKKKKVPYNARTERRASSNDLSTFSSYDEAIKVMHDYTGVGFIVSHDICAVDLDDCVNEAGELNEIAQNVIAYFPNCYIEKSPSGSGLHIYFKVSNVDYDTDIYYINKRKLGIEVYIAGVTKCFLTLTGDIFQDGKLEDMTDTLLQFLEVFMKRPSTVRQNDLDEAVSYLSDESVIEKASKSVNREKFKKLWNGDIPSYESRSEADLALTSILAFWCGRDIAQMDRLFRKSGSMRDKWDRKQSGTTYGQITSETARRNVFTTYKPYDISSASDDFSDDDLERLKDMQPFKNNHCACTDIGNSNLFADYYKSVAHYIPERKKWFVYNGQAWESDTGNLKVMQLCKQLANQLMYYALSIEDENIRKTYIDFAMKWQVRRNRKIILRDAQDVHPISMSSFDRNKYLLNCKNGTLNLRTNTFHPHCSEDFITKVAGVHYDPLARCERWEQFVHEVMIGDLEKATFFQKCLGYVLTCDTRYETMFILFGATTRNGKGTSMETFLKKCGDYGKTSRPETIDMKINSSSSAPSEDVARLAGSRFVNISEPDKKLTLSAALLKTLTGNDTIQAFKIKTFKIASMSRLKKSFTLDTQFDLEKYLCTYFAKRLGRAEENKFLNANGQTEPQGLLQKDAAVITGEAGMISYDNLINLYFSVDVHYHKNSVFMMSDETAMHLRKLKDENGFPIFNGTNNTIFGKPVHISAYMPAIKSGKKAILFGHLAYFWVIERQPFL